MSLAHILERSSEWENYGNVPVSRDDTVFPDECEERKQPADDGGST